MDNKITFKKSKGHFDGKRHNRFMDDEAGMMASPGEVKWTLKKQRPILFNTEMVLAVLAGNKTQTRRAVRKPTIADKMGGEWMVNLCPYGKVGDQLWVRETWFEKKKVHMVGPLVMLSSDEIVYGYKADLPKEIVLGMKFKPSIFMPKAASRILLEITNVRCERLHEITESDAKAEGITLPNYAEQAIVHVKYPAPSEIFEMLWQKINSKRYPWEENPWVYVVEFKRIKP